MLETDVSNKRRKKTLTERKKAQPLLSLLH